MVGKTRLLVYLFCIKKENRTFFFLPFVLSFSVSESAESCETSWDILFYFLE